jgi:hypothetical protein
MVVGCSRCILISRIGIDRISGHGNSLLGERHGHDHIEKVVQPFTDELSRRRAQYENVHDPEPGVEQGRIPPKNTLKWVLCNACYGSTFDLHMDRTPMMNDQHRTSIDSQLCWAAIALAAGMLIALFVLVN